MIRRLMIAGAAVIALTTGAGQAAETPAASPSGGAEVKAAPKQSEKELTDHEGNKLTLTFDDAGKVVKTAAKSKDDKVLDVVGHDMKDFSVCIARKAKKPLCQPLKSMSDAASFRMGTATCTCQVYNGYLYCYGTTCH